MSSVIIFQFFPTSSSSILIVNLFSFLSQKLDVEEACAEETTSAEKLAQQISKDALVEQKTKSGYVIG